MSINVYMLLITTILLPSYLQEQASTESTSQVIFDSTDFSSY